jgi:hypothetical protein
MQTPPHDITAEQAALGAMLCSSAAAETVRQELSPLDFYRPLHQTLFTTITSMMRNGEPVDAVTVKSQLDTSGERYDPSYLLTLLEAVPSAANAAHYARLVREKAVRRRLREAGHRVLQLADQEHEDSWGAAERAIREVEAARDSGLGAGLTAVTYQEFLSADDGEPEYDWVIPGLLERGDRLVLTGTPGMGKSTLWRQIAVTSAAGMHPFTHQRIPKPARCWLLDCENGPAQIRRKLRPLIHQVRSMGFPVAEADLWVESRVNGLDLARDKDVSWLLHQVGAIRPDIVLLGPLYKMAPRALNDDTDAAPVLAALDLIRGRGACVLVEAHHGHGTEMRPRGSSALQGWPEFGLGLRAPKPKQKDPFGADGPVLKNRTAQLVRWRGDRDEREWPSVLASGGILPWSSVSLPPGYAAPEAWWAE